MDESGQGRVFSYWFHAQETLIETQYNCLSSEHIISHWLNRFFRKNIAEDEHVQIQVCDRMQDPNAFVTKNGKIYISKGLLRLIDFEEELGFILSHEYVHYKEDHFSKDLDLVNIIERKRYHEYRADFGSSILSKQDYTNGGIILFRKLSDLNNNSGIVHGRSIDRLLNLCWNTRIIDIKDLSYNNIDLPKEVNEYAQGRNGDSTLEYLTSQDCRKINIGNRQISNLTTRQCIYILKETNKICGKRNDHSQIYNYQKRTFEKTLCHFYDALKKETTESRLLAGLILSATCGIDLNNSREQKTINNIIGEFEDFFSVTELQKTLSEKNLVEYGIGGLFIYPLVSLMEGVFADIAESLSKKDFDFRTYFKKVEEITECISIIYHEKERTFVKEEIMKYALKQGAYSFKQNDPTIIKYIALFEKYLSVGKIHKVLEEENILRSDARIENERNLISIIESLSEDNGPDIRNKKPYSMVALKEYLESTKKDDMELYQEIRDFRAKYPSLNILMGKELQEYVRNIDQCIEYIAECKLGKINENNLENQIILFRALYKDFIPEIIIEDINTSLQSITSPKNTKKRYSIERFERILHYLQDEDIVKERYPFVE
jgi:hypothetical protein